MISPSSLRQSSTDVAATVHPFDQARAYSLCVEKTRRNITRLADRPISGAWAVDGNYFGFAEGFFEIGNWTSSFFTGMALLAFENGGDLFFLRETNRLADVYRDKVTRQGADTMHDLGFLYSLYSVALHRITGAPEHRQTALLAADALAKRFVPTGGYIQAWGRMDDHESDYAGLAIIDCMMNLPLLFWAARETGNRFYAQVAIRHADTTLAHFVRRDDSVCHAFRFDVASGKPIGPENYCGRSIDSHWARGTAWAVYGFALAYRHTHDARYLAASARLARKFVALLGNDAIPVWDFRLGGHEPLRDSSAAAIMVCGIDEVVSHEPDAALAGKAASLLNALCTDTYLDPRLDCPGVLRAAEVGDGPDRDQGAIRAKNIYASWGDYFFMEALARRLHRTPCYW
jgi:unsaturated chondroitin disaccharide hydrolase